MNAREIYARLEREGRPLELLLDIAKPPIERTLHSAAYDRAHSELLGAKLIQRVHVFPGQSSFSDYYELTPLGRTVLNEHKLHLGRMRGRRKHDVNENPMSMGPNVVGWSIAALIAGVIAIGVAVYESKSSTNDKAL